MSNSLGSLLKINTWGESHGECIGVIIDGCPPNVEIDVNDIQYEINRRSPGQSFITTKRKERDQVKIVSGISNGLSIGTPITIIINNTDYNNKDYKEIKVKYRPSHSEYTYKNKYKILKAEGGGRSSARETIARVAAGAIAKKILVGYLNSPIEIRAYVERVCDITIPKLKLVKDCKIKIPFPSIKEIEKKPIRCPHYNTANKMINNIRYICSKGDSLGGVIRCRVRGLPLGLGSPIFKKLEADLGQSMLTLPASKGFEIGSGFEGTHLIGSQHNDIIIKKNERNSMETNNSGGVQGGISNGEELSFAVCFKPTATILKRQCTVCILGNITELVCTGRHDPCVLSRAVPIVESMTALILVDHYLLHKGQCRSL